MLNPDVEDFHKAAGCLRNNIDVNVMQCDTENKKPLVPWLEWQDKQLPEWPWLNVRSILFRMINVHYHEKVGGYS